MEDWRELLEGVEDADHEGEYGPNTAAVLSAFAVLGETEWLEAAGDGPEAGAGQVVWVKSWDEVFAEFEEDKGLYDSSGHLLEPAVRCQAVMQSEKYRAHFEKAVEDAGEYYSQSPYIPDDLEDWQQSWLEEYLYQYVSYLLAELVGAEDAGTTYFRELLPWFHAGRLPCGWEGEWPAGRLRVF